MIPLLGAAAELACLTIVGVIYLFMWALLPLSFVVTPFVNVPFFSVNRRLRYFGRKKIKYRCLSKHLCYCGFQKIKEFFKMVDESGPSENTSHLETKVYNPPYDGSEYYLQGTGLSGYSFYNNDAIICIINKVKTQGFLLVNRNLYSYFDHKQTGLSLEEQQRTDGYVYYRVIFNSSVTSFFADIRNGKIYFINGNPFPFSSNNYSYSYFAEADIKI